MDSCESEVTFDFFPYFRIYKDGHIERLVGSNMVPPSPDPHTGVLSKDVIVSTETGVSARIFLPNVNTSDQPHRKLPLLVYFHGGAFCIGSAFSSAYHHYVSSLVAEANVIAVSVDYRLAPEHLLPTAHLDCLAALKWVASHSKGEGPEAWLNDHSDFDRVFLAGDSAGANLVHYVAMRVGESEVDGLKNLLGIALIHPYFEGREPVAPGTSDEEKKSKVSKFWAYLCPSTSGCDDPLINPAAGPSMSSLGCTRVAVWVAEKDSVRKEGVFYYEWLKKSGWGGVVEISEEQGEEHVFHLVKPDSEKAMAMMKRLSSFLNQKLEHNNSLL
ncbi:PREDICTED: probable carboxylesterase 2 [Nelumbo nucifera]|uniref:Alpha/beta hydrolase fold-3 domain-containing protein n=2 Tax=Nelumbo nucifera TaxID=4432 RepID=A0A822XPT2_NELNU|nr:PREDICTED: probable carboxylesterase 2 [Nelumbo nucifera]DAD22337.1 TPA_asm: hypothetical protein HUJ06_023800 [Nelumbo nucifera]